MSAETHVLGAEETQSRRRRLGASLARAGFSCMILDDPAALVYLTGQVFAGSVVVGADGRTVALVARSGEDPAAADDLEVRPLARFADLVAAVRELGGDRRGPVGADLERLPAARYLRLQEALGQGTVQDAGALWRRVRMVKSPAERQAMRQAARVWEAGVLAAMSRLAGPLPVDEWDVMMAVEEAVRRAGHEGLVRLRQGELFLAQVVSGPHAAVPGAFPGAVGGPGPSRASGLGAGHRPVSPGEPVLVDLVGNAGGYLWDGTRVLVQGRLPDDLARAQEVAEEIYRSLAERLRPGTPVRQLWRQAEEMARKAGLLEWFMGSERGRVRFVGHGVGLELDEWPVLSATSEDVLEAGMTLAVEPKFVFPGKGAVGVENTLFVTEDGPECATELPTALLRL